MMKTKHNNESEIIMQSEKKVNNMGHDLTTAEGRQRADRDVTRRNRYDTNRNDTVFYFAVAEEKRRKDLEDVLTGEANELPLDYFSLVVELDIPGRQSDHLRLLRVANLALQYYGPGLSNVTPTTRQKLLKNIALACQVNPNELDAYVVVLGNEIRYREQNGSGPLENLPTLSKSENLPKLSTMEKTALSEGIELLALPSGSRAKHESWEYIELAEQGFNNRESAEILEDTTESSVRRGLKKGGYKRAA
jgi:hypothetical protein